MMQVEAAGSRVEAELGRILGVVNTHIASTPTSLARQAVAVPDIINNGVWVKLQGRSGRKVPVSMPARQHMHPQTLDSVLKRSRKLLCLLARLVRSWQSVCYLWVPARGLNTWSRA